MARRRRFRTPAAFAVAALWPLASEAVTQDSFLVRTTQDIVELCTAPPSDPLHVQAVHFCHGYLVGAFQYHVSTFPTSGPDAMFCLPEPQPSRNETIARFIEWARSNPRYLGERPVETEFRWLAAAFPCRR
jgi:hypothetical protein